MLGYTDILRLNRGRFEQGCDYEYEIDCAAYDLEAGSAGSIGIHY
jgi:hypothetical protein